MMASEAIMINSTEQDAGRDSAAMGAPIERVNPLGKEVTLLSAVMLNLGEMLGSGIFVVPGVIMHSIGSVGLLLVFWVAAPMFSFAGLSVYAELASVCPVRSGAEAVYLEQAYPYPRLLVPITFAVMTVLLAFSATNAIIFARYFMETFDIIPSATKQTFLSIFAISFAVIFVGTSTKWSLRAANVFTTGKVLAHIFVVATGIAVLTGITRIEHPFSNFSDPWAGSIYDGNALATSLVKTLYAYVGWNNAFNVLAEVKSRDPVRTVRNASAIAMALAAILFLFINVAYIAAIPKSEIADPRYLVGALFFQRVFGESWAAKILPVMVTFSCLGNLLAVTIGQARIIREIARQGLIPWPEFFASTQPFGTPLGPVALKLTLTIIVIFILPAHDAFNFLLDLVSYRNLIFSAATAVGIRVLRRRRALEKLPPAKYQASNIFVYTYLASCIFLVIMPWVPPKDGRSDVSFWYATYCVVTICMFMACGVYYYFWIILLPRLGGYEIVEETEELADGVRLARLVKKYYDSPPNLQPERQPLLQS